MMEKFKQPAPTHFLIISEDFLSMINMRFQASSYEHAMLMHLKDGDQFGKYIIKVSSLCGQDEAYSIPMNNRKMVVQQPYKREPHPYERVPGNTERTRSIQAGTCPKCKAQTYRMTKVGMECALEDCGYYPT